MQVKSEGGCGQSVGRRKRQRLTSSSSGMSSSSSSGSTKNAADWDRKREAGRQEFMSHRRKVRGSNSSSSSEWRLRFHNEMLSIRKGRVITTYFGYDALPLRDTRLLRTVGRSHTHTYTYPAHSYALSYNFSTFHSILSEAYFLFSE